MPHEKGSRLGAYEILGPLGAGGMGEVYRARDAALGRDVAIKVLPPGFSADPDRLRRFMQEAQAAAALNHPNILAIYQVGEQDGGAVHRLRTARGRDPRGGVARRRALAAEGDRARRAGRPRTRRGTRQGHRPSRSEAGQPVRHTRRTRQDSRLRPREADWRRRKGVPGRSRHDVRAYERGNRAWHGRVHVARAGARAAGRRTHRSLQPRRDPVRDDHRDACLPGRDGGRHAERDPSRGAAADDGVQSGDPAGARADRAPLPREEPARAVPVGTRPRLRSRADLVGICAGVDAGRGASPGAGAALASPGAWWGRAHGRGRRGRYALAASHRSGRRAGLHEADLPEGAGPVGPVRAGREDRRVRRRLGRRSHGDVSRHARQPGVARARDRTIRCLCRVLERRACPRHPQELPVPPGGCDAGPHAAARRRRAPGNEGPRRVRGLGPGWIARGHARYRRRRSARVPRRQDAVRDARPHSPDPRVAGRYARSVPTPGRIGHRPERRGPGGEDAHAVDRMAQHRRARVGARRQRGVVFGRGERFGVGPLRGPGGWTAASGSARSRSAGAARSRGGRPCARHAPYWRERRPLHAARRHAGARLVLARRVLTRGCLDRRPVGAAVRRGRRRRCRRYPCTSARPTDRLRCGWAAVSR